MVAALFQTNILLNNRNRIESAKTELERYTGKAISVIAWTWMDVMAGATPETEALIRCFLNGFDILPIAEGVSEAAVKLRNNHNIKLPDAIVWATAQVDMHIIVTRNTKDFYPDEPGIRVPYRL